MDGELAVDEVVVVGDDEEKSDCEYDPSCSSRKRAASRSVPNIFVAMVTETHGVSHSHPLESISLFRLSLNID